MNQTAPTEAIAALLRLTGSAHGAYETSVLGGVYDEDWPTWYAAYLIEHGLPDLLGVAGRVDADRLAGVLVRLDADHRADAGNEPWPSYYARRLPELLG